MTDKHTIRLVSQNPHDQLVMKSILGILGQRACKSWSYAEDHCDSEVVVVDVDKELPNFTSLREANHCRVIVSYGETSRFIPEINFSLPKPIRAKDLLVLLTDIEKTLTLPVHVVLPGRVPEKVPTDSIQKTLTSTKLLDQLLTAAKQSNDAIVEINLGNQQLYLDNRRKKIFANGPLFASQLAEGPLLCRTTDKIPLTALESLTFTDIFYELTLLQSSASLANDLSVKDEFTIKQWPNMSHSRHAKSMIRTAAYFSKQKATINKAARDLALEVNHIIGFINAVHSQNLLVSHPVMALAMAAPEHTGFAANTKQTAEPAVPVQAKTSSGLGGLFGRIRQKLGM